MIIRRPEETTAEDGVEVSEPVVEWHGCDGGMGGRQIGANLGPRRLDRDDAGSVDSIYGNAGPACVNQISGEAGGVSKTA
jgi:hypothetical protein